jgi:hypothetical protein
MLLGSQVSKRFVSEEVLVKPIQWAAKPICVIASHIFLAMEAAFYVLNRPCRPDHVEIEQSIVGHAQSDRPALHPVLHVIIGHLQVIPLFRFRCVFAGVLTTLISASFWVKLQDVNCCWGEHSKADIVRDNKLIVFRQTSLQTHPLCGFAKALMRLARPREEKATRTSLASQGKNGFP